MTANLSRSDTGGASNSVPQIDPVFSYEACGGDIYVYLVKTEIAKFAIISFDDTYDEYAFAVQTLTSRSKYEAVELVRNAEKSFNYFEQDNPFTQLYDDPDAMSDLAVVLAEFFESGD